MKDLTFTELVDELNSLSIQQKSYDWPTDIPEDLWDTFIEGQYKHIATDLDIETHRWYDVKTVVLLLKRYNKFLGIRVVGTVYSEGMSLNDCMHIFRFMEMEEVPTTTYIPKGKKLNT